MQGWETYLARCTRYEIGRLGTDEADLVSAGHPDPLSGYPDPLSAAQRPDVDPVAGTMLSAVRAERELK